MNVADTGQEKNLRVALLALFANLIATLLKVLFHEDFYDRAAHPYAVLVCGIIGVLVSSVTIVFSLKRLQGRWRVIVVIGSLVAGYWWLSDIASRMMTK
jgi:hypothetical protein